MLGITDFIDEISENTVRSRIQGMHDAKKMQLMGYYNDLNQDDSILTGIHDNEYGYIQVDDVMIIFDQIAGSSLGANGYIQYCSLVDTEVLKRAQYEKYIEGGIEEPEEIEEAEDHGICICIDNYRIKNYCSKEVNTKRLFNKLRGFSSWSYDMWCDYYNLVTSQFFLDKDFKLYIFMLKDIIFTDIGEVITSYVELMTFLEEWK